MFTISFPMFSSYLMHTKSQGSNVDGPRWMPSEVVGYNTEEELWAQEAHISYGLHNGQLACAPFAPEEDTISVFLGYSLYKHPWKDSPEQKAVSALLERYTELQDTMRDCLPTVFSSLSYPIQHPVTFHLVLYVLLLIGQITSDSQATPKSTLANVYWEDWLAKFFLILNNLKNLLIYKSHLIKSSLNYWKNASCTEVNYHPKKIQGSKW